MANPVVASGTWTGNSNFTTTIGARFRLYNITIKYDADITNNATITLDANAGANYDTVLYTFLNGGGESSNYAEFDAGAFFVSGDEIIVACDVGANNAYCRVVYELV